MRTRVLGVLLVLALASTACGDDAEKEAATTTTSTTVAEKAEDDADDLALAEAVVLTIDDLPEGVEWSSEPADEEEDDEGGAAFRVCMGLPPDTGRPSADSPTFSSGDATQVDSSATVAPTAEQIDEDFARLEGPEFVDCAKKQFEAAIGEQSDVTFGPLQAERLDFPTVGDGATAVRLSTKVETGDGETLPFHFDVVLLKKGRVGMTLTLVNAPEPFPTELSVPMAEAMAARA
ncbi:MAG: hypothetical protein ACR2MO_05300 [Acidimicrobiales bacterium]